MASIHRQSFPGFFLSSLGEAFLTEFYAGFLHDPSAVAVVARDQLDNVVGAVVGTTEPSGFYRRLLRSRWPEFVAASLQSIAVRPSIAPRLLRAVRYRGITGDAVEGAQLSSICVDPHAQGIGVGRALLDEWVREVGHRGVSQAVLTTDAMDNDAVNRFYVANSWYLAGQLTTAEGRLMNRYMKATAPADA